MEKAKNIWSGALLSIGYGSGLRRNEILHLIWKDIDFESQMIRVVSKKNTANTLEWELKNHSKRIVPMSDETSQLLASLQLQAPGELSIHIHLAEEISMHYGTSRERQTGFAFKGPMIPRIVTSWYNCNLR